MKTQPETTTALFSSSAHFVRRALSFAMLLAGALGLLATPAWPQPNEGDSKADLGEIGAKISDPLSEIWALSTSWSLPAFYDGDINTGDPELGASFALQPVMPIPLYGSGKEEWRLITRPIVPFIFSTPIPEGFNDFDHKGGIGDIQLPLVLAVPASIAGSFILGAGPVFQFPTATSNDLGKDQWGLGPAVVLGYKTKFFTAVLFPNYFWKIGSAGQGSVPDLNQGSLLYGLTFNLPDAWQIGTNPTISYNHKASSGNKWTVPVGLWAGRTVMMHNTPVNIRLGVEYSVVSPDDFGQRAQIRLQVTPVIPSLIQMPIFGR